MKIEDLQTQIYENNILIITIKREEFKNALRTNTLKEISQTLKHYENEISCAIITGGENIFAAGADINELEVKTTKEALNEKRNEYWADIKNYKLPVIAAVNGYCLGGGFELALSCDIIISGDNAIFGLPEVNLGIMPGAGGTQRLTKAIGKSNAMLFLLSGNFINAKRAYELNISSEVLPYKSTLIKAKQIAKQISQKAPLSISSIKSSVLESYNQGLNDSLKFEKLAFASLLSTNDKQEGIKAFKEKRKPKYKGN